MATTKTDVETTGMSTKLPYVIQPGSLTKIFAKIKEAKSPDRFTVDFLQTKLGFKGGNYRQFIPLAKKLGLLESDGSPTDLYKKIRNPATSKTAIAQAIKIGYREIFDRNEYAYNLTKDQLKGLIVEITGLEPKSDVVQKVCQTIDTLKAQADFEAAVTESSKEEAEKRAVEKEETYAPGDETYLKGLKMGLSYSINLVLPKTDDPAVFNAIFRSLRDNLLRH